MAERIDVFISYRRADGKIFAKRLRADLKKQGFNAWMDERNMPSGEPFIAAIDSAIESARYFLLVFTPEAIKSEYCQDEWKRAIEQAKPIIPLLFIGTDADLPEEVKLNDRRDFRKNAQYARELNRLIEQLSLTPKQPGKWHNVRDQLSYHLKRTNELGKLRDMLIEHKIKVMTSPRRRIGIHGMGGIGKSELAVALARDYSIRRSFSDGIFWLTFGPNSDSKNQLSRLRGWLNGGNAPFKDTIEAIDFFADATRDRECLIILDDVWEKEHVCPFSRLGEKTRLLVTTRSAKILNEIDAHAYEIDLLSDEQSQQLLEKITDKPYDKLPLITSSIIKACGNLPLALSMIGAMVKGKPLSYWESALESLQNADLKEIAARFPDYAYPNLFAAIEVSVNALTDDLRNYYYDFAIFTDDPKIPEKVFLSFWKPLNKASVLNVLRELASRNLLRLAADGSVTMHNLQFVYLTYKVDDKTDRHNRLLTNYNNSRTDWHTIEDDTYLYNNLVYHLKRAGDNQAINILFYDQSWMQKRIPHDDNRYDGYISDLTTNWEFAENDAEREIGLGKVPDIVTLCLRSALIRTSVNSLAANYPADLVVRAVREKIWSPERALSIAKRVPSLKNRNEMINELVNAGLIPEALQTVDIKEILSSDDTEPFPLMRTNLLNKLRIAGTKNIDDDEDISEFATEFDVDQQFIPLEKELSNALVIQDNDLSSVVLNVINSQLQKTIDLAKPRINVQNLRVEYLHKHTPRLSIDWLMDAYASTKHIDDALIRAFVLDEVGAQIPFDFIPEKFPNAEAIASVALKIFTPNLTYPKRRGYLLEAISTIITIENEVSKANLLVLLISQVFLDTDLLVKILNAAIKIKPEYERVNIFIAIAPYLPYLPSEFVENALSRFSDIENESYGAIAIRAFAPHLSVKLQLDALYAAQKMTDQTETLIYTVLCLPYDYLDEVVNSADNITNENDRAKFLIALVPYLPIELVQQVVFVARHIQNEFLIATILSNTIPYLPPSEHPKILEEIRLIFLTLLRRNESNERKTVLKLFDDEDESLDRTIFTPPILNPEILGEFAHQIDEICNHWKWL